MPAKLWMFLWRLAQVSLPSEDVRHHRRMSASSCCSLSGALDSWRHSLIECTMSHCIWTLVNGDLLDHLIATTELNPKAWLFAMFDSLSHVQLMRLVVTLWAIWTARRKAIHEDIFQSPFQTHDFVIRYIKELDDLNNLKAPRTASYVVPPPHVNT